MGGHSRKDLAFCLRCCGSSQVLPSWKPFERDVLIFLMVTPLSFFPLKLFLPT